MSRQRPGPKPADLNVNRLLALREQRFSYDEIGARFGIGRNAIRRAILRHKLGDAYYTSKAR